MTGPWVTFEARLERLPWGPSAYTVLVLPETLVQGARALGTRRVEGTLDQVGVNLGIARADAAPGAFVHVSRALQRRMGVAAGEVVRCRLRPADREEVPLPDDVARALERTGTQEAFEVLPGAERRRRVALVEQAGHRRARADRLDELVRDLLA